MLSHALPTHLRLSPLLVTGSHLHLLLARPGWWLAGLGAMAPCLPPLMASEA